MARKKQEQLQAEQLARRKGAAATEIQKMWRGAMGRRRAERRARKIKERIERDYNRAQASAQRELVRQFEARKAKELQEARREDAAWRRKVQADAERRTEEWTLAVRAEQNEMLARLTEHRLEDSQLGVVRRCAAQERQALCRLTESLFLRGG